jgi:Flp pilus assembly protein TadG
MTKRSSVAKQPAGAAVVEFAVVLPLFFMIVMGGIELGRALLVRHTLEEAARSGCRVAAARGGTAADAQSLVDQAMSTTSITGYTVTVDPDPPTEVETGDPVTVTVTVPYRNVGWVPVPSYMGSKTIIARCVMPAEGEGTVDSSNGSGGSNNNNNKKAKKSKKAKSKSKVPPKKKSKKKN